MKRRKDGRWMKKISIDGTTKYFYSAEQTERKAEQDIQQQLIAYQSKQYNKRHNFLELAEDVIEEKSKTVSNGTLTCYRAALKHLSCFYDSYIEDITPAMLQKKLNQMAIEQFSQSSISKAKIFFGLVINHAILQGINVNNFMSSIKIPKNTVKNKILSATDTDIANIIKSAETANFGMWAMVLLCTGMRRGELTALQAKDIDFELKTIHVWRAAEFINNRPNLKNMPKSVSGVRDIPILDILYDPLLRHCKGLAPDDFIFGGAQPLTETMIKKRWKKYCTDIGINVRQHQLRHAYAKILYRAGVDAKTAQGLLGHADIQTTMNIYTDFSEDVTIKSANMINAFVNNSF